MWKKAFSQLSVRGVDKHLERHLRELARREGVSLNKAALMLMRRGAGLAESKTSSPIGNALDRFIGSWSEGREQKILGSIASFEVVDESFWK
jgi:hypothetical protein